MICKIKMFMTLSGRCQELRTLTSLRFLKPVNVGRLDSVK
jgi:hypothetical protein